MQDKARLLAQLKTLENQSESTAKWIEVVTVLRGNIASNDYLQRKNATTPIKSLTTISPVYRALFALIDLTVERRKNELGDCNIQLLEEIRILPYSVKS